MALAFSTRQLLFAVPSSSAGCSARLSVTLVAAFLLACGHSGCTKGLGEKGAGPVCATAGGYAYLHTRPEYVKGSGATGSITCNFAPKSPVKPTTITFSAAGRSARVPGTITGLSRGMQYVQFSNSADGAVFPKPAAKVQLKPSPRERDASILVTVKK